MTNASLVEWPDIEDACKGGIGILLANGSDPVETGRLRRMVRDYGRILARIHRAPLERRKSMIDAIAVPNYAAKVCALLRSPSISKWNCKQLHNMAKALNFLTPLTETVNAYWQVERGKARLIVPYGPKRRAQSVFLNDMMAAAWLDNPNDYSRKGRGERAFSQRVIREMKDGVNYWWTPDFKKCFLSLKPAHFRKLPLDNRLVRNVGFLPGCAHIKVQMPSGPLRSAVKAELVELLGLGDVSDLSDVSIVSYSIKLARQKLPTGAVASPRMMRWLIGQIVEDCLSIPGDVGLSYSDNQAFGSHTRTAVEGMVSKVVKHCTELPAGPLSFDHLEVVHRNRVFLLNNKYSERKTASGRSIRVTPGRKRYRRFEEQLQLRLDEAVTKGEDAVYAALRYSARWYASQVSYTKVEPYSRNWFKSVLSSYWMDFQNGDPIGTFYIDNIANSGAAASAPTSPKSTIKIGGSVS